MWNYDKDYDLYRHADRSDFYVRWNDKLRRCWLINDEEDFCTDLSTKGGLYAALDVADGVVRGWYS